MCLVNRTRVSQLIVARVDAKHRSDQITRISPKVYAALEATIRKQVDAMIDSQPSSFKTLEPS